MTTQRDSTKPIVLSGTSGSDELAKRALLKQFLEECGAFWNRPVTEALLNAWWKRVEEYRWEALHRGFEEFLDSSEYFPVPGTVLPLIEKRFGAKESR